MFHVYVLINKENQLYVGYTSDLKKRIKQHQSGEGGWTHSRGPWELVYSEPYETHAEAMRREIILKNGKMNQELHKLIDKELL